MSNTNIITHDCTSSFIGSKLNFKNNFGLRGCMAASICFGSFLKLRSRDEILKAFLEFVRKDAMFKNAIFKSNGNCNNVYRKDYLISQMSAKLKLKPFEYLNIVNNYSILHLNNKKGDNHFVMLYHYNTDGSCSLYDPSFPFFINNLIGFFRYYSLKEDRHFFKIRDYPYNP